MTIDKNKNILIVGLGLLGGSYAKALKNNGYKVKAITKEQSSIDYAVKNNIIDTGFDYIDKTAIEGSDLIIFALYPHIFIEWVTENQNYFKSGAVITDVTGVKGPVVNKIQSILRSDVEFISAHPMAGRETSGVENSDPAIFKNANYIVVPTEFNTPYAIEMCKELGRILNFKSISVLSCEEHDNMIAFLSQLTHCIAISLMCSNDCSGLEDYTGDSFRDLTRIAKINDKMWSELFSLNKTQLLNQMDLFKISFNNLYDKILNDDTKGMREMMQLSTLRRKAFDK